MRRGVHKGRNTLGGPAIYFLVGQVESGRGSHQLLESRLGDRHQLIHGLVWASTIPTKCAYFFFFFFP